MTARTFDRFLGCETPEGFFSLFDQLTSDNAPFTTYIIKGSPGCGKSTLMRRIAERVSARGLDAELIHCASDPDSLDGVICPALRFALVDGTAPHVVEPRYPQAGHRVISLYDCVDHARVSLRCGEIIERTSRCQTLHERAARFSAAAGSLITDLRREALRDMDLSKLERFADGLAARLMPPTGQKGCVARRFLSSVGPQGFCDYGPANAACYDRRFLLRDRHGALAARLVALLAERALAAGYEITLCPDPLDPRESEALLIDALSLCFMSSASPYSRAIPGARSIHERRFQRQAALRENRAAFCKKAALALLDQCGELLAEAKAEHDRLEEIYIGCVDFAAVRELERSLCRELRV